MNQKAIKEKLKSAFLFHAKGHIEKHLANVEVLLSNPVGIGEHGDIINEIEKELKEVAQYEDLIDAMNKYFPDEKEKLEGWLFLKRWYNYIMDFYTNVVQWGNFLLVRGVDNNQRVNFRLKYIPTLFVPVMKQTDWKTLDGKSVTL